MGGNDISIPLPILIPLPALLTNIAIASDFFDFLVMMVFKLLPIAASFDSDQLSKDDVDEEEGELPPFPLPPLAVLADELEDIDDVEDDDPSS